MKLIVAALLTGGSVITGSIPNPKVGECIFTDIVVTRSEPTFVDPDGAVTGMRIWQVCGFSVPTDTGGSIAVDDLFVTEIDVDAAIELVEAADDLLGDDGVYLPE